MKIFKNDNGSTALTVLIALVLTVALLAVSLQWYWVNTTSADIQHFADMGALTAGEAVGRVAAVIQVLDLVLLTLNLFGLVVHGITVVAGIISVSGTPFAVAASAFLPRAVEFDKKFVDGRKRFSESAFSAAKRASDVAPYLMFGYANAMVGDEIKAREGYNATSYKILPIPFPVKGTVTRSAYPSDEAQLMGSVEEVSNKNTVHAARLKELEDSRRKVLDEAYRADVYKSAADIRATWTLKDALNHFLVESLALGERAQSKIVDIDPIDHTSVPARERIKNAYLRDCLIVQEQIGPGISNALGAYQPASETYSSQYLSLSDLFAPLRSTKVHLLEHEDGERKAYHAKESCTGLQNAQSVLHTVELASVVGDSNHPPCSLCLPLHYGALETLEELVVSFAEAWNKEVALIEEYNRLTREIQDLSSEVQTISKEAFEVLLSKAREYLSGGRLTYEPAGSRGILCIAFSTNTRKLPRFTLPSFTNSGEVELGYQVAMAGVRLYPTKDTTSINVSAENLHGSIQEEIPRLGGAIFELLNGDENLVSVMQPIWEACTTAITRNDNTLENVASALPWGVGPLLQSTLKSLKEATGLAKPDTRTLKPFLVNTSTLGSVDAPGPEGVFARGVRDAKRTYEATGGGNVVGLAEVVQESLATYEGNITQRVLSVLPGTFEFGGALMLPFYRGLTSVTQSSILWAKGYAHEFIAHIP